MKLFKILFGLIGGLILLLLVIATVLVILIYDNSHKINEDIIKADKPVTEVIGSLNYDALDTTNEDKLSYGFTELKMNELLYAITKTVKLDPIEINGFGATYNSDGSVSVYAPAKYSFFTTALVATLDIEDTNTDITLVIKELKLGSLSTSWFGNLIDKAIDEKKVENEINKQTNLDVTVKFKDGALRITIKDETFFNLIKNKINDENSLFTTLIDVVLENKDLFEIDFDSDKKGFVINLTKLATDYNENYSMEKAFIEKYGVTVNEKVIDKVQELTKKATINQTEGDAVINFLIRGYDNISSSEQEIINNLDLSELEFASQASKENHQGYFVRDEFELTSADIDDKVHAAVTPEHGVFDPNLGFTVLVTNNELNSVLDKQPFQGKTFAVYNENNEINYIMISKAYLYILDNELRLSVMLNLNGKEITITVTLKTLGPGINYKINASLESIKMGDVVLSGDRAMSVMNYLSTNIEDDGFIGVDTANNVISVDLSDFFNNSDQVANIQSLYHFNNKIELVDGGMLVSYYL